MHVSAALFELWRCVCVGGGTVAEPVGTAACCSVGRASRCCAILLLLLLLLLLAACGARCIVSQGTTRQLPTSPFLRFRGRALPIGNTGGGCDEQARARAAVLLLRALLLLCCCAVDSEADFQAAGLWAFFCLAFFLSLWKRLWVRERILRRHSGASAPV